MTYDKLCQERLPHAVSARMSHGMIVTVTHRSIRERQKVILFMAQDTLYVDWTRRKTETHTARSRLSLTGRKAATIRDSSQETLFFEEAWGLFSL